MTRAEVQLRPSLWPQVAEAYRTSWRLRREYWFLAWRWSLAMAAALWLFNWHLWPVYQWSQDNNLILFDPKIYIELILANLVGASIGLGWHRLLLLGEQPTPESRLRLDAAVLAYFMKSSSVAVAVQLPVLIAIQLADWADVSPSGTLALALAIALVAVLVPALLVGSRMMLVLPALAIADDTAHVRGAGFDTASFKSAWRSSRGFTLALAGGSAITLAPVLAVAVLYGAVSLLFEPQSELALVFLECTFGVAGLLAAGPYMSFLAACHRALQMSAVHAP